MTAGFNLWKPAGTKTLASSAQLEKMRAALGAAAATGFTASTAGRTFTPDDAFQVIPYTGASPMNIPAGLLTPAGNIGWRATVVGAGVLSWPVGVTVALASDGELTPLVSPLDIDAAVWSLGQYHPSNAALFLLDVTAEGGGGPAFSLSVPREYTAPQVETSVSLGSDLTGTVSVNCADRSVFHGSIADGAQVVFECDGMLNGQTITLVLSRNLGDAEASVYVAAVPGGLTTLYSGSNTIPPSVTGVILRITRRGPNLTRFVEIVQLVAVATPVLNPGIAGIFHLDDGFSNAVAGGFALAPNGERTFTPMRFGNGVQWGADWSWAESDVLADCTRDNGVMIDGWIQWSGSGADASWVELKLAGVPQVGIGVRPSASTGLLIRSGPGSLNATSGRPAPDVPVHYVFALQKVGADYFISWAINGNWLSSLAQSAACGAGPLSIAGFGSPPGGAHRYDATRFTFGVANFPFTPGVDFTPPTEPPTVYD